MGLLDRLRRGAKESAPATRASVRQMLAGTPADLPALAEALGLRWIPDDVDIAPGWLALEPFAKTTRHRGSAMVNGLLGEENVRVRVFRVDARENGRPATFTIAVLDLAPDRKPDLRAPADARIRLQAYGPVLGAWMQGEGGVEAYLDLMDAGLAARSS